MTPYIPAKQGWQISDLDFAVLPINLRNNPVPHGRRSSFRDWCAETGAVRYLAEASLSHSLVGAVETAYLRIDLAEWPPARDAAMRGFLRWLRASE